MNGGIDDANPHDSLSCEGYCRTMEVDDRSKNPWCDAVEAGRLWVISVVGWVLMAGFMTLARAEDAATQGRHLNFWAEFVQTLPFFIPLMGLSWALQLGLKRWPSLTQVPRRSALLFLGVLFLFFPAYLVYEAMIGLAQSGAPLANLPSALNGQSRVGWWIDGVIVMGAVVLHYALASRSRMVERDAALQRQLTDNFQLRLTLLQSQLEPHFLFNALNSISALVRSDDRTLALEVLEQVSDLLRYALRASRSGMLTMRDELDFTNRYLSVQSMRHGERLQIDCRIQDEHWNTISCPPLLLQPLIENALRHGVEAMPGTNRVTLSVGCSGGAVVIQITNDIDKNVPASPGNGMGLSLVRDRLHALFGTRASLSTNQSDRTFTATVQFPADDHDG